MISSQSPANVQRRNARQLAELSRQVAPGRTGPRSVWPRTNGGSHLTPENSIKNKAVIGWLAPVRRADCQDETLKESPFLVRYQVSRQAGLHRRYQLELWLQPHVNPFCQHRLGNGSFIQDGLDDAGREQRGA